MRRCAGCVLPWRACGRWASKEGRVTGDVQKTQRCQKHCMVSQALQSLVLDTNKAQLPWSSGSTPVSSPQIPFVAYSSFVSFCYLQPKESLPRPSHFTDEDNKSRGLHWWVTELRLQFRSSDQLSAVPPFQASRVNLLSRPGRFWNHEEKCYSSMANRLKHHDLCLVILESAFPTSHVFSPFFCNPVKLSSRAVTTCIVCLWILHLRDS